MNIAPLDLILLLGSLQGIILFFLLWYNPKGPRLPNKLLAWLMGLMGLASFAVGVPVANMWISHALDLLPFIVTMPMGPIIYFYAKALLNPEFRIGRRGKWHFYPIIIDFGSQLIGWTFLFGILLGVFNPQNNLSWANAMDAYDTYSDIPRWLSLTTYLWLTHRLLSRQTKTEATLPEEQQHHIGWLKPLVRAFFIFQFIWLLYLIPYIIPATRNGLLDTFGWYPIYIPIAILIYWIGFRGYFHTQKNFTQNYRKVPATLLPEETANGTIQFLKKAMATDQLFLDPELTVEKVSRHVGIPAKIISAVLNQHLQKSFNTFVNGYRVAEVKKRLLDPVNQSSTLVGIAFDCGFNSQATFQRAFRSETNQSPKEFIAEQLQNLKINAQIRI
ncbi:AraC family transcriptional regulator [Adhaeribacter arboris]|uniref:AraC family transcriptional regulator n=2 Tax=Adhaeribacter arboris TaxID=2072846 RepID=A0A2T2YP71_9BACT|nr:AraC family transcriptional regulator [Adhaeribacter arboris]